MIDLLDLMFETFDVHVEALEGDTKTIVFQNRAGDFNSTNTLTPVNRKLLLHNVQEIYLAIKDPDQNA